MKGCGFKSLGESFQWKVRKFFPINISFELEIVTSSGAPMVRTLSSGMKGFGFKSLGESFQSKI
jgi:hypothetical protein